MFLCLWYLQNLLSNGSQVVLQNVGFGLSGNFSCEITAESPPFSTATANIHMQVVGKYNADKFLFNYLYGFGLFFLKSLVLLHFWSYSIVHRNIKKKTLNVFIFDLIAKKFEVIFFLLIVEIKESLFIYNCYFLIKKKWNSFCRTSRNKAISVDRKRSIWAWRCVEG